MTITELEQIRDKEVPLTGRLCVALAKALLAAWEACNAESAHEASAGAGHPFVFGYKTAQRVVVAAIMAEPLP